MKITRTPNTFLGYKTPDEEAQKIRETMEKKQ